MSCGATIFNDLGRGARSTWPGLLATALALLLLGPVPASAQSTACPSTAVGRAGGSVASRRTADALLLNPASLAPHDLSTSTFSIGLAQGCGGLGGDLLRFDLYQRHLTRGARLSPDSVDQILDEWFGTESDAAGSVRFASRFIPISIVYRSSVWSVAVTTQVRILGDLQLTRGWFDLAGSGLESGSTIVLDGSVRWAAYRSLSLSYARTIGPLSLGVTPKFVEGLAYLDADLRSTLVHDGDRIGLGYRLDQFGAGVAESFVRSQNRDGLPDVHPFTDFATGASAGSGWGLDLGAVLELTDRTTLGVSVTDLGSIRWKGSSRFEDRTDRPVLLDSLDLGETLPGTESRSGGILDGSGTIPVDSLYSDTYMGRPVAARRRAPLASVLRVGWSHVGRRVLVHADASFPLRSERGINGSGSAVAVAAEFGVGPVGLQAGLSYGVGIDLGVSAGVRLQWSGIGLELGGSVTPSSSGRETRYAAGFGLSFR